MICHRCAMTCRSGATKSKGTPMKIGAKRDGGNSDVFSPRIDMWTADGESIVEHIAGVEDYQVALATYRAAVERWPGGAITLRQGARVMKTAGGSGGMWPASHTARAVCGRRATPLGRCRGTSGTEQGA